MKDHLTGRNIDLDALSQGVCLFFSEKGFATRLDRSKDTFEVSASLRDENEPRTVRVKMYGRPEDFYVEFISAGEETRSVLKLKSLMNLFGGGALLLRPYRATEFYGKLEEQFWTHLDLLVDRSAISSR